MDAIEQKIRELPVKKLWLKPANALGSYVDSAVEMVQLEDVLDVVKKMLTDSELRGLTELFDRFRVQVETKIQSLPVKRFKIDPFSQYNQAASLCVEEAYVELSDVLDLIRQEKSRYEWVVNFAIASLCQVIRWKEEHLSDRAKKDSNPAGITLPELQGRKEQVARAAAIRERAIASLMGDESVSQLSPNSKAGIEAIIAKTTSAAWWINNSHRTSFAILLALSHALDEALLAQLPEMPR